MQDTTVNYEQWKTWATLPNKQNPEWEGFDLEAVELLSPYISLYMTTPTVIFNQTEYTHITYAVTDLEVAITSAKNTSIKPILYWVSKSVVNDVTSWTFRFVKLS